jgi:hydrogenase maturation factor
MKNRVHVGFAITGLNEEEISLLEGGGKTMRHIKIPTLENIDEKKLVKLIKMVDKKAICKPC